MNFLSLWAWGQGELQKGGVENPRFEAELLLREVMGMDRAQFLAHPESGFSEEKEERYRDFIWQRSLGTPTQYILGKQEFYGREFLVTPAVLVPRPETEVLVEEVLKRLSQPPAASHQPPQDAIRSPLSAHCRGTALECPPFSHQRPGTSDQGPSPRRLVAGGYTFLDLCTGSGCIGLTLAAELPRAKVTLSDISQDALDVAQRNAENLQLADRVELVQGDLFSGLASRRFHVIVSNPPYVESEALAGLSREVRNEPPDALDGGADGLDFYRRIAHEAPAYLADNGLLALEIGDSQGQAVMELLGKAGFTDLALALDLAGRQRVVVAREDRGGGS